MDTTHQRAVAAGRTCPSPASPGPTTHMSPLTTVRSIPPRSFTHVSHTVRSLHGAIVSQFLYGVVLYWVGFVVGVPSRVAFPRIQFPCDRRNRTCDATPPSQMYKSVGRSRRSEEPQLGSGRLVAATLAPRWSFYKMDNCPYPRG
ncbi:hypothetical protein BHE74_00015207 [Ensete ventricosum]|nr:hypothetical protein BHE74_00015207 [Ensete ventricosum]